MIVRAKLLQLARPVKWWIQARGLHWRLDHKITRNHFRYLGDLGEAKKLFKASIRMVEVETSTYCNRRCWFCPNSYIDRISVNHRMSDDLYAKILKDLAEIDYDGRFSYSRYNEPLADRAILDRLREARAALPHATLVTHSNGDYLDREYLDELYNAGLRRLRVQVYLGNNDRFDDKRMLERLHAKAKELRVPYALWKVRPGVVYEARLFYKDMYLSLTSNNFDELGCTRGGLVQLGESPLRTSPCAFVFENMYIDWDGAIVPCCNIRSDAEAHRKHVVDTLTPDGSIFASFANTALVEWRRNLIGWGPKASPCDTCHLDEIPQTHGLTQMSARKVRVAELQN